MTTGLPRGIALLAQLLAAVLLGTVLASAVLIPVAPPAAADAPGPTDYVTTIVGLEPPIAGIELEVIGGDSFILMRVPAGLDVVVTGYASEPYLWFRPDGQVLENRASPATWANQNRFGETDLPDGVSADAPPRWSAIGENGTAAWHDHRSHWMNPGKPLGSEPGDLVIDNAIPMIVSGRDVVIRVESHLLAPPPVWPAFVGLAVGAAAVVAAIRSSRFGAAIALAAVAIASLALGLAAFGSVPSVTEPSQLLWLLPVIGIAAAVMLMGLRNRLSTTVYLDGLVTAGGAAVAAWGISRFDAIQRSFIPSDAPANLDRIVIVVAILIGCAAVIRGVIGLVRPERLVVTP